MLVPWMTSACLLAVMRVGVSDEVSTVWSIGSIDGMAVRVQFWPDPPLALVGMFAEQ